VKGREPMADSTNNGKTKKPSFFKGVQREFKKITWPDARTVGKQALAVIVIATISGVIIAFLDQGVQYGIDWLTSIQF
jgi:preprotein translocase subunit SecE